MRIVLLLAAVALSAPAEAEVVSSSGSGFEVREIVPLVVAPGAAYGAFTNIGAWWDPQQTYSGDSSNLSLALAPGGCFCERMPKSDGGIEHLRVKLIEPGKRIVMTGAVGPLLFEAVNGVMDVAIKPVAGGSELTLDYRASGFAKSGADKLAPVVDRILSAQMKRLRTFAAAQPRF